MIAVVIQNKKTNQINKIIEQAYVINLDERTDRWQRVQNLLTKNSICNFERFSAISPNPENHEELFSARHKFFTARGEDKKINIDKIIRGAAGCLLSHIEVIKLAKQRNLHHVLILEDDFNWMCYANRQLEKAANFIFHENWDMIFLGGKPSKGYTQKNSIHRNLKKISGVKLAHAYLVHHSAYDKIINQALSYGEPIDWYYINIMQKQSKCFMFQPKLSYQQDGYSDIEQRRLNKRRKRKDKVLHLIYSIMHKLY